MITDSPSSLPAWRELEVSDDLRPLATKPRMVFSSLPYAEQARYFEFDLVLSLPASEQRRFEHGKLYYGASPEAFDEAHVLTFRVGTLDQMETVRVRLPAQTAGTFALRLEPAPGAIAGNYRILGARILSAGGDDRMTQVADLEAHKEQVRRLVAQSEASQIAIAPHFPSSLSIELTPRCNLTCGHCSSHGRAELHRAHNRAPELDADALRRLGEEVFPSLTSICIVGRGEPTMVSERLWSTFVEQVVKHRVLLSIVTNGYFLRRRITPELLPFVDSVMFSVDGDTPETFATNRGGADFAKVWDAVEWFHEMRTRARLARRPRLNFSWTMKRNNVHELPAFVRRIAKVEADLLYSRHLLVFFDGEEEQSLLNRPDLANPHLREAYALLALHQIRTDCVPLLEENRQAALVNIGRSQNPPPLAAASRDGCMFIHRTGVILADGEVPTCSAPFVARAGYLRDAATFEAIWNGEVMQGVRKALNTEAEWEQCTNCWYREGHYQRQRKAIAASSRHDIAQPSTFSERAWTFTAQDKTPNVSK